MQPLDFTGAAACCKTYPLCNGRQKIGGGSVFGFPCRVHLDGGGVGGHIVLSNVLGCRGLWKPLRAVQQPERIDRLSFFIDNIP